MGLAHSVIHRIYSISSDIYTPVSLFKENTNQNGLNLNLFIAGKGNISAFLLDRLYHTEPKVTRQGRRLIWKLPSINRSSVNATLIEADRCFSHFFLRQGFITIPEWVLFTMDISMPLENILGKRNKSEKNDFRKMVKYQYVYDVGSDSERLRLFYYKMYLPYTISRFGKLTILSSFSEMEDLLDKGELLLVKRGGEYLSGMIIYTAPSIPIVAFLGVMDGRIDYVKQGALSALYYYTILWAKEKGYTKLDFGHCRPVLNDGVFLYKKKLGMKIQRSPRKHRMLFLSINNLNPYLEQFFTNNPLIYENQCKLKGLLFVKRNAQSTEQEIEALKKRYFISGLADFTVVLSNGTIVNSNSETIVNKSN